jgi:hypothetical protein
MLMPYLVFQLIIWTLGSLTIMCGDNKKFGSLYITMIINAGVIGWTIYLITTLS